MLCASLGEISAQAPLAEKHLETPRSLKITNVSADTTEIQVYGTIGGGGLWDAGGVNAADFKSELSAISTPNIHVRINSGGGDVFEAVAMHTALRNHGATVTCYVDALAASAASFLAMAGERVVMEQGAMMMLHAASTYTYGTRKDHDETSELLGKVSGVIAEFYALRTGETPEEWLARLDSGDTWYTAKEAMEAGLADRVAEDLDAGQVSVRLRKWSDKLPAAVLAELPPAAEPFDAPEETETPETETSEEHEEQPEETSEHGDLQDQISRGLLAAALAG